MPLVDFRLREHDPRGHRFLDYFEQGGMASNKNHTEERRKGFI
jgi:hypothetical protein